MPQTKRSHPHPRLEKLNHNAAGLPQNIERTNKALDNLTSKKEKPTIPPTSSQTNMEEAPCGAGSHDHNRRKKLPPSIGTSSDHSLDQIKTKFRFVANPNKTLLHNASSTLAHTPTWYYFSRLSHSAYHDFTQSKQLPKKFRSLLGLGLKFIPTPRYTNTWKKLRDLSMPKFTRAIHLRFHFAGTNTTQDDTYNPKIYVRSNWTPPHWTMRPVVMTKRLENFSNTLGKLFKKRMGKTNLLPYQTRASATTSTATGLPCLRMRQKPWAGDHRTR